MTARPDTAVTTSFDEIPFDSINSAIVSTTTSRSMISPSTMASGRSARFPNRTREGRSPEWSSSTTFTALDPMSRPTVRFDPRLNLNMNLSLLPGACVSLRTLVKAAGRESDHRRLEEVGGFPRLAEAATAQVDPEPQILGRRRQVVVPVSIEIEGGHTFRHRIDPSDAMRNVVDT